MSGTLINQYLLTFIRLPRKPVAFELITDADADAAAAAADAVVKHCLGRHLRHESNIRQLVSKHEKGRTWSHSVDDTIIDLLGSARTQWLA